MNITLKFIDETLLSLDDLLQKKGGGALVLKVKL